ncbi:MAG: NAD-dependent epimerase/dehydratase family protein [Candidatus Margulisiibacteriota bacterium]|nr:NAD-dependent epimerase/dehydratase family protein [Candidatus Margulisiibacteriota bacterium]
MSKKIIGVTGYSGFIGSHLLERLSRDNNITAIPIEDASFKQPSELLNSVKKCDCIVQLAGMNRGDEDDIYKTNIDLANTLVKAIEKSGKKINLVFASSILSSTDSAFGRSKKDSCSIFEKWAKKNNASLANLIIPNVFGDRGRPFYNSVVATFCYQLTRGEEPKILADREVEFIYINDLTETIYEIVLSSPKGVDNLRIKGTKKIKVSELLEILEQFKESYFMNGIIPKLNDPFLVNLYNVFLSYLEYEKLNHNPQVHSDQRGELFEILKLAQGGQVFFSKTKPGHIRGNHYHIRKAEKFCVIEGDAVIRMRRVGTKEIKEFKIKSGRPAFVDIPIFHTHHIENVGKNDLYTLFWCNELYDPNDKDTYPEEVFKS